jgi:hypothetical protein
MNAISAGMLPMNSMKDPNMSRVINTLTVVLTLALLLLAGTQARAGGDYGAVQITGTASEGADGGTFYSPLPPKVQEDLGDIRPAAAATFLSYFHGQATLNTQYTSNAPLYHSRDESDFLILPTLQGGLTVPLNKYFKFDSEARMEDFTYASHQKLGFWGFSGDMDIDYRYKPTWPRLFAGVEPYYYFSYETGTRYTADIGPVAGIDQTLSINRGKTLLLAGYHFGQYYTWPFGIDHGSTYDLDTRQSHTVILSLTQQIKPDLYAQFYWQGQYSDYEVANRDELRNVVGVTLIHQFTPKTYLSVFVNYVDNASNDSLAKYEALNAGVSMVLQF